jgi:hypothetical protein
MADTKISALPSATTPLAGTEVLPIVQGGTTDQVSVANLTAGRTVAAARLNTSNSTVGGVMSTFSSGWSNTTVSLQGDGATGAGVLNISNVAATAALPFQLQLNGTKVLGSSTAGNVDVTIGNLVIGTAGKGISLPGNITWTSGAGSPEGVVTAPVGSLYSRSDGGVLTSLYVKQSGTGNTGWAGK